MKKYAKLIIYLGIMLGALMQQRGSHVSDNPTNDEDAAIKPYLEAADHAIINQQYVRISLAAIIQIRRGEGKKNPDWKYGNTGTSSPISGTST